MNFDIKFDIFILIVCVMLLLAFTVGHNACTAQDWNNGVCPRCDKRTILLIPCSLNLSTSF